MKFSSALLAVGFNSCGPVMPVDHVEFQAFKALQHATVMAINDCDVQVEGMASLDPEGSIPGYRAQVEQALNMRDGSPVGDESCLLRVASAVSGNTILGNRDCEISGGTHLIPHPINPNKDGWGLTVFVDCMPEDPATS